LLTVEEIFKQPVVPGRDEDSDFTSGNVTQYIYHLADDILVKCGLSKYYNVDMDKYSWPWLEDINMSQKSNFYERAVVNSYRVIDPSTVMKEAMGEEEDEDDAFDDLDNFDV
jgi:ribonucleotide reductase beta subunit family protein with ferritin-like domain